MSLGSLSEFVAQLEALRVPILIAEPEAPFTVQAGRAQTVYTFDGIDPEDYGLDLKVGKDFQIGYFNQGMEEPKFSDNDYIYAYWSSGTLSYSYDENTHGRLQLTVTGDVTQTQDTYYILCHGNREYSYHTPDGDNIVKVDVDTICTNHVYNGWYWWNDSSHYRMCRYCYERDTQSHNKKLVYEDLGYRGKHFTYSYCSTCDSYFGDEREEWHSWSNSRCTKCGFSTVCNACGKTATIEKIYTATESGAYYEVEATGQKQYLDIGETTAIYFCSAHRSYYLINYKGLTNTATNTIG